MGFNEYAKDSIFYYNENDYDDDEDYTEEPLDPESWQDWHSERLLDGYMDIRDRYESQYLRVPFTFNSYCEYKYSQS
jgi:hypothetical protein